MFDEKRELKISSVEEKTFFKTNSLKRVESLKDRKFLKLVKKFMNFKFCRLFSSKTHYFLCIA